MKKQRIIDLTVEEDDIIDLTGKTKFVEGGPLLEVAKYLTIEDVISFMLIDQKTCNYLCGHQRNILGYIMRSSFVNLDFHLSTNTKLLRRVMETLIKKSNHNIPTILTAKAKTSSWITINHTDQNLYDKNIGFIGQSPKGPSILLGHGLIEEDTICNDTFDRAIFYVFGDSGVSFWKSIIDKASFDQIFK